MAEDLDDGIIPALNTLLKGRINLIENQLEIGERPLIVRPDDWTVQDLSHYEKAPKRIRVEKSFAEAISLVRYASRFPSYRDIGLLEASLRKYFMRLTLDYSRDDDLSWHEHIAEVEFQDSDEWKTWFPGHDTKRRFDQLELAEFLDENVQDIIEGPENEPGASGAAMLEMARNFDSHRNVVFRRSIRLQDGSQEFEYIDKETESKDKIAVPEYFWISIPRFQNVDDHIALRMNIRWRARDGELAFILQAVDFMRRDSSFWRRMVNATSVELGLDPLFMP